MQSLLSLSIHNLINEGIDYPEPSGSVMPKSGKLV